MHAAQWGEGGDQKPSAWRFPSFSHHLTPSATDTKSHPTGGTGVSPVQAQANVALPFRDHNEA